MKKKFSQAWKKSKQPRKQRKYMYNMPLHLRHKMLSATLSKELRKKHAKRNFPLRKGDMVSITKGDFRGKKAKVVKIDLHHLRIFLEGMQKTKKDGTKINISFKAPNLKIIELNLDDRRRIAALERNKDKKNSGETGEKKK